MSFFLLYDQKSVTISSKTISKLFEEIFIDMKLQKNYSNIIFNNFKKIGFLTLYIYILKYNV